jgi:hypothetical protein
VEVGIITNSFDPIDFIGQNETDPITGAYRESLEVPGFRFHLRVLCQQTA